MATPEKTKGGPVRTPLQYNTTEVPDFEAHHEHFRQSCEKFKHERRTHTVPQPFRFYASEQSKARAASSRARNLKQQRDPSSSLAWKKRDDAVQAEKEAEPPPTRVAMQAIVARQVKE